jgi:hypothetical protein
MQHINDISNAIAGAIAHERASHLYHGRLTQLIPQLHVYLNLPQQNTIDALLAFTIDYIESVPGALQLVTQVSRKHGFYRYAASFLHLAEDFFLQPPQDLSCVAGLEALLDESFLAHRLLEEVSDHHTRALGQPLLPVDMTEANIIVHHLLGDKLASGLDSLVRLATSGLLGKESVWDDVPGRFEPLKVVDFSDIQHSTIRLRTATA